MKFRKKPVIIEAEQLTKEKCWDYWINNKLLFGLFSVSGEFHREDHKIYSAYVSIETLEGTMKANLGDYVIKGIKGEYYPCKPVIFNATYEPVEGENT